MENKQIISKLIICMFVTKKICEIQSGNADNHLKQINLKERLNKKR